MATIEIKVPDIGDFKDVAVIELLVKPGDTVKAEQSLITVESDKASMEIPSSHAGTVKELKLKVGDTVNQGSLILVLDAAGAAAPRPQPHAVHRRLHRLRSGRGGTQRPHQRPPATPAAPTSSATCSCSAPAQAATRRPSARPTSA